MQIPYSRRSDGRIEVMLKNYSFFGKTVLDIGCNTGYITNALRKAGAGIVGLDSDPKVVAEAQHLYPKCNFFVKSVTPEMIRSLELKYDCMLLLAVLQHVLTDMRCYEQPQYGMDRALALLKAIRLKTTSLWFEMAYPTEVQRDGAGKLPKAMWDNPDRWIRYELLFQAGFEHVHTFPAPELKDAKFQSFLHRNAYANLVMGPQWFRDILRFDDRDARSLFLAW